MAHRELIIDGVRFPSVTEILGSRPKPWLDKWKAKWGVWADRKTAAAAAVGTAFHTGCEDLCAERSHVPVTMRLYGMLGQFDSWRLARCLRVVDQELHVVSKLHHYQGTFDATGYLADKPRTLTLFDWKTSGKIHEDYELQLAAYAQAYLEQTGKRIRRAFIVRVDKRRPDHRLEVKEYNLTDAKVRKFLARLKEYNEFNPAIRYASRGLV